MNKENILRWAEVQNLTVYGKSILFNDTEINTGIYLSETFIELDYGYKILFEDSLSEFFEKLGVEGSYNIENYCIKVGYPNSIEELLSLAQRLCSIYPFKKEGIMQQDGEELFYYEYSQGLLFIDLTESLNEDEIENLRHLKKYISFVQDLKDGFRIRDIKLQPTVNEQDVICIDIGYLSESDFSIVLEEVARSIKSVLYLCRLPSLKEETV